MKKQFLTLGLCALSFPLLAQTVDTAQLKQNIKVHRIDYQIVSQREDISVKQGILLMGFLGNLIQSDNAILEQERKKKGDKKP